MKTFQFAIMGAGKIANKFCDAVKTIEGCEVSAISSKTLGKARDVAKAHGIAHYYDNYEEMLLEMKPDCVYIATVPSSHYEHSMLCLDHNTPVLCEKAMFMNSMQAKTVFDTARQRNLFVMEAMWSYFLPAVKKAQEWILGNKIGDVKYIQTNIGFIPPEDPQNRYFNKELGGGAAYDITVYAYELLRYMMKEPIQEIKTHVIWGDTNIDITEHITVLYKNAIASLTTSFAANLDDGMQVFGSRGKVYMPHPHYGNEAYLYNNQNEIVEHFLDSTTNNGFVYEIEETMDCIRKGQIESETVPHAITLDCAALFDRINQCQDF